jgi:hypothetical protein
MKRLRSSTIFRSAVGSMRDQKFRNLTPKCRGSHVESRIARIEVVSDFGEEKGRGLPTCSAHVGRRSGKSRTDGQTPGHPVDVPVHDHADEIKKD